jgi:lipopolysaccharide transport system permease protein
MMRKAFGLAIGFGHFVGALLRDRRLIMELARRECRNRYLGSAFGLAWAFIHPAAMILIYWVVFQYGLKSGPVNGIPFVAWLTAGIVPWFFFSDCIGSGSSVLLDNRFLVKKVVFRVSVLPVVRLLSLLPAHLFLVVAVSLVVWASGYPPTWRCLEALYYMVAMMVLGMGLSWLTSALVPFLKDLTQVVQVGLQILFWVTPIVWPAEQVPANRQWILNLNPLHYIVQGYRDSLTCGSSFWQNAQGAAQFWIVTAVIVATGGIVFLRLRPHFADVI